MTVLFNVSKVLIGLTCCYAEMIWFW